MSNVQSISSGSEVGKFDISSILTSVGDFFGGSSTSGGGQTITKNSVSGGVAALVTIVVIAIIAIIIPAITKTLPIH